MKNRLSRLLVFIGCAVALFAMLGMTALAEAPCTHEYARIERPTGNVYPATCIEAGGYYVEVTCDGCGAHLYEYKQPDPTNYPIDKSNHKFVVNTLQGECAGGSAEQKVCTLCGYTETDTSNSGHNWVARSYAASTCGETSYTYDECSKCGMTQNYKNSTTVSAHTYTKNPIVHVRPATCSAQGEDQQLCDCGAKTKVIPLAKIAHSYAAPVTTQGNCTTKTRKTETCTVCGYVHVISEGNVVHNYVERDVVAATCTEPGVRESRCSVCGALNWQTSTPKLGHSYTYYQSDSSHHWRACNRCGAVADSGSHVGNNTTDYCTNRVSCKICGYLMSAGTKHPGYTAVDSGNDSTHDMKCTSCSYVSSRVSHTYTAVDGNCTKGRVCTACGHQTNGNAQHSLSSIWASTGASQHSRKCTNSGCGYAVKEDHEWGEWVVVKEATTTSVGTESRKCVKCPTTTVRAIPQLQPGAATKEADPATATPEPTDAQQTAGNVTATAAPEITTGSAAATATPEIASGGAAATATPKITSGSAAATATPKITSGSAATTAAPAGAVTAATSSTGESTAAPAAEVAEAQPTDHIVEAISEDRESQAANHTPIARLTEGTACAAAGRACAEEEFLQGGMLIRVCTICGHVTAQALFDGMEDAQPVFAAVSDATVTGAAQEGHLVLLAASLADAVHSDETVYLALSAAWELDGQAQSLAGAIQVSVPLRVTDGADETVLAVPTARFRLVRVDVEIDEENGRIEAWTDVDYTYADGVLTFEMDRAAIYLLIPA